MTGRFIVFEGGEGGGKTTQAARLADTLTAAGVSVTLTREPGATPVGSDIRDLLLDPDLPPIPPMTEALLYAADRAANVDLVVRPALARGDVVISDRYVDSTVAYQGGGRGVQQVLLVSEIATRFLQPDLVVLLDVDPHVGLARAAGRAGTGRIERETVEFHQRVRAAYLSRAALGENERSPSRGRYMVVDAAEPADVIADLVADRVRELLAAGVEPVPAGAGVGGAA